MAPIANLQLYGDSQDSELWQKISNAALKILLCSLKIPDPNDKAVRIRVLPTQFDGQNMRIEFTGGGVEYPEISNDIFDPTDKLLIAQEELRRFFHLLCLQGYNLSKFHCRLDLWRDTTFLLHEGEVLESSREIPDEVLGRLKEEASKIEYARVKCFISRELFASCRQFADPEKGELLDSLLWYSVQERVAELLGFETSRIPLFYELPEVTDSAVSVEVDFELRDPSETIDVISREVLARSVMDVVNNHFTKDIGEKEVWIRQGMPEVTQVMPLPQA